MSAKILADDVDSFLLSVKILADRQHNSKEPFGPRGIAMADDLSPRLSRRERQILDIIYARGEATAIQVVEDMADPPSRTAVRTLLRILEEKGHLKHRQDGKTYVYRPSRPRTLAGQSALRRVLQTFFDGSLERAVAAHLGDEQSNLSPGELQRMISLIRQARKEGR
jgi:predicted transcriptional regulator